MPRRHKANHWAIRVHVEEPIRCPKVHLGGRDGSRVSVRIDTGHVLAGAVGPQARLAQALDWIARQRRISQRMPEAEPMKNPPDIQAARVIEPGVIELRWSTGETLNVDLTDLAQRNGAFAKLSRPAFFARMERDQWGHGIGWPGGLDLGADRLYELCREQAGLPTAREFDAWMERNGLSLSGAAESLGMTRRMIAHYRTGSKPIPKVVGLACKGWEVQQATPG